IPSVLVDRAIWKSITSCVNYSDIVRNIQAASRWRRKHVHYLIDLLLGETGASRVVTTFIFSTRPKEGAHAVRSEPIIFIDRGYHGDSPPAIRSPAEPGRLQHPIEHLAVVHLHHVAAARDAERFHRIGGHHAHLGIGGHRRGADGVGVELHELAKAP